MKLRLLCAAMLIASLAGCGDKPPPGTPNTDMQVPTYESTRGPGKETGAGEVPKVAKK